VKDDREARAQKREADDKNKKSAVKVSREGGAGGASPAAARGGEGGAGGGSEGAEVGWEAGSLNSDDEGAQSDLETVEVMERTT
jgi:hypothetical protein